MNLFLAVAVGVSTRKLWMMIGTLQLLVHLPLMSIPFPANATMCFQALVSVANMNILPKEYTNKVINLIQGKSADDEEESSGSSGGKFQDMGFDNGNLMKSMGLIFLVLAATAVLGITIVLVRKLLQKYAFARKIYESISKKLFFNSYLRST